MATRIDRNLSKTRHAARHSGLSVACPKQRLVVASGRAYVCLFLADVRKIAMQESRIDGPLACDERQRHQDEQRSHFPTTSRITRRKFPPMIFLMSGSL